MNAAVGSRLRVGDPQGDVYVRVLFRWSEASRHYANHGVIVSCQRHCFPEDMRVSVQEVLPELVADDDDARAALDVFFRRDDAAEQGRNAESFEESSVDVTGVNLKRLGPAGVVHLGEIDSAAAGKLTGLPLDV